MAAKALLPPEVLRQLLRYEPDTGKLFWRQAPVGVFEDQKYSAEWTCAMWNGKYAGNEALTNRSPNGYLKGKVLSHRCAAHRVAWCLVTGEWPEGEIDHIDCNPSNNRWTNLRLASRKQNNCNRPSRSGSSSQFLGVCWAKKKNKWKAQIRIEGRQVYLGLFTDEKAAAAAYDAAAAKHHGAFAKINITTKET